MGPSRAATGPARQLAQGRRTQACDALHAVIDDVLPIDAGIVAQAKALVLGYPTLSARDAVHVAVMREHGITRLMSFDEGFDAVPGVTRLA